MRTGGGGGTDVGLCSSTTNGVFSKVVTPATQPPNAILKLNTTSWALLIPELAQQYPDMPMQLTSSPTSPPSVAVSSAGMVGTIPMNLNYGVITSTGVVPVFDLTSTFTVGLDVTIGARNNTPVINLNVTTLSLELGVVSSQVGTINVIPIQGLLDTVLPFFRTLINDVIKNGIELPLLPGVQLLQPAVVFGDGYLAIACNFVLA